MQSGPSDYHGKVTNEAPLSYKNKPFCSIKRVFFAYTSHIRENRFANNRGGGARGDDSLITSGEG